MVVTDFQTRTPQVADANGVISYPVDSNRQNAVLVPSASGRVWVVPFPGRGHRTVDLSGRYVTSTTTVFNWRFIRQEYGMELYSFTEEEEAAIESGEWTIEEVKEKMRREAAEAEVTANAN